MFDAQYFKVMAVFCFLGTIYLAVVGAWKQALVTVVAAALLGVWGGVQGRIERKR